MDKSSALRARKSGRKKVREVGRFESRGRAWLGEMLLFSMIPSGGFWLLGVPLYMLFVSMEEKRRGGERYSGCT